MLTCKDSTSVISAFKTWSLALSISIPRRTVAEAGSRTRAMTILVWARSWTTNSSCTYVGCMDGSVDENARSRAGERTYAETARRTGDDVGRHVDSI